MVGLQQKQRRTAVLFALGAVLAAEYAAKHEGFLTMQDLFHF